MLDALDPAWVNHLQLLLYRLQLGLLDLLQQLGLARELYGQPAWPWGSRIDLEVIAIDRGHARQLVYALLSAVLMMLALCCALLLGRWRARLCWGLALLLLWLTPWPSPALLLAPAYPTSFHRSTSGYTAQGIVRGQQLYQQHCMACHGVEGDGEGPRAASLPMWPPNLNGALLWRRSDGDLLWHVLHGMRDRQGLSTMPGFAGQLQVEEVWQLLDFLQAQAAGQSLRRRGEWPQPVALPDGELRCEAASGLTRSSLRALQGQRLRIVAGNGQPLTEDPRLLTIELTGDAAGQGLCQADGRALWQAFALLAGVSPDALGGMQFIVDRAGWVRARSRPGQEAWSAEDLLCRAGAQSGTQQDQAVPSADGLGDLIRRMERQPVQLVKGGVPH
jgi:mono/diheme cytochrome c family protein